MQQYVNQPIELNNVNPEIIKENNIYEYQIIEINHDKEIKQEPNEKSITGLVTDPEIKPGQDSQKPKTNNWIYVICFFCFAIVILVFSICVRRYFFKIEIRETFSDTQDLSENKTFEIYRNSGTLLFYSVEKIDIRLKDLQNIDYYISYIFNYLNFFWNFTSVEKEPAIIKDYPYDQKITINSKEITFPNCVIFKTYSHDTKKTYEIYFYQDDRLRNFVLSYSEPVGIFQKPYLNIDNLPELKKINPNIKTAEHLEEFFNYFIEKTKEEILANHETLKKPRSPTDLINTGLTFFPKMADVKNWKPGQKQK